MVFQMAKPFDLIGHSGDFHNVQFVKSNQEEIESETGMTVFDEFGNLLDDNIALKECKGSLHDYMNDRCVISTPAVI